MENLPQDWWLTPDEIEALLRLLAAAGCGMIIGINRDLRGKPTGMRTLGLVGLGAALVSLSAMRVEGINGHPDATSRVVQGIVQGVMTGIGFLGAGVVLRDRHKLEVHGLTTAATVWVTAALGVACAIASWHLVFLALATTFVLLALMLPLERVLERVAPPPERRSAPLSDNADEEPPR
ncbi:MgtC/SapB family protein [Starkeya koreensis]|uniref:Protein MgtC n=1 Tax=Ancylobacter koreensis TaxID=266121 RepID=A0ABT0DMW8_9HYPH|nr:MgtC/SapB family protein [Ancylobacter koreensis]MCK0208534.1 MgtC/SapB family protein [Ancylobacter koreensis]